MLYLQVIATPLFLVLQTFSEGKVKALSNNMRLDRSGSWQGVT
jgi:hypothetical protein